MGQIPPKSRQLSAFYPLDVAPMRDEALHFDGG
jgi:hypothetical protein